ncbi:MAG: HNH endonuclease [Candidatus Competibacteraceae bacterium]|nr:HNH endonuclease [Candidatus Competibacteraceae bacterium]
MWLKNADELTAEYGVKASTVVGLQCTAEHLVARQDGGANAADNIVAACKTCNGRRHRKAVPLSPENHRRRVRARILGGKWHPQALVQLLHDRAP